MIWYDIWSISARNHGYVLNLCFESVKSLGFPAGNFLGSASGLRPPVTGRVWTLSVVGERTGWCGGLPTGKPWENHRKMVVSWNLEWDLPSFVSSSNMACWKPWTIDFSDFPIQTSIQWGGKFSASHGHQKVNMFKLGLFRVIWCFSP